MNLLEVRFVADGFEPRICRKLIVEKVNMMPSCYAGSEGRLSIHDNRSFVSKFNSVQFVHL